MKEKNKKTYTKPEMLQMDTRIASMSACGLTSYGNCGKLVQKRT